MLSDEDMLKEFVQTAEIVNVNVRRGGPLSLARAVSLGVRRVTYATSLFREARSAVEQIAAGIKEDAATT